MLGYKGFDKDLKCKTKNYSIGEVFSTGSTNPKVCDASSLHFCGSLEEVFNWYPNKNGNRFCEVEALGQVVGDSSKYGTNSLKILREVSQEEVYECQLGRNFHLELLRTIQTKYPLCFVGGSLGLFLHGIRLKRFINPEEKDIDLIMPYYISLEGDENNTIDEMDCKNSGNDFDNTFIWNSVIVDVKIDPRQKYEVVPYKGFKYKVALLETIIEAKVRYALNKQQKHKNDIYEICGKIK